MTEIGVSVKRANPKAGPIYFPTSETRETV